MRPHRPLTLSALQSFRPSKTTAFVKARFPRQPPLSSTPNPAICSARQAAINKRILGVQRSQRAFSTTLPQNEQPKH